MVCPFAHDSFALIAYIELVNADAPCDTSCDFFYFIFFSNMHLIGWDTHSRFIKEGMSSWNFSTAFEGQPSVTSRGSAQTPSRAHVFFFLPLRCNLIFSRCTAYTALRIVDNLPKITASVMFFPQIIFSRCFVSTFFFFFFNKNDLGHEFKKVLIC